MVKNELYSFELKQVLSYIEDILVNDFPTEVFTPEYVILSLLYVESCHANLILDNCLMSDNINKLRDIYVNLLRAHTNPNANINKEKFTYSEELQKILNLAEKEKEYTHSEKIGTEHVLLAIMNPANEIPQGEVFQSVGLKYDFIKSKCTNKSNKTKSDKNNLGSKQKAKPNIFPLKSEVNTTAISNKSTFVEQYTTNINNLVKEGKVDKLIGRESELKHIIKIMARRKKNNVVLVGKSGCGLTQIVYGLAQLIESGEVPTILDGKKIVMLNAMELVSGTHFRGMFEERVKGLFDELKASTNYILFIDDIQSVLKGGSKDKDTDISSMIGNILAGGEVRVIGTTNFKEYRNTIESNTQIARKLQKVVVEPNTVQETIEIINQNKHYYEEFHNVEYSDEVIKSTVELAERYITDRALPDSAIDIIDLAGACTCLTGKEPQEIIDIRKELLSINDKKEESLNNGDFEVMDELNNTENKLKAKIAEYKRSSSNDRISNKVQIKVEDILSTISETTGVPVTKLNLDEKKKIAHIDDILKESVIGQDEAVDSVCKVIKRNRVGLGDKNKTMAVFFMCGKSGCGKTLIAKQLAKEIFGSENDLVRIDMSEYSEKNSVSKLTGSAPGYVGYENGGQLTEAIKNKQHCVLLLDEIEKADPEVHNVFLQLFDEGRLTDSAGQVVNFKNVIIIMTSNVGAKQASEMGGGLGFVTDENANKQRIIEKQLKKKFTPEFINRIDKIVYFNDLSNDNLLEIVKLELNKFRKRIQELSYEINFDDETVNFLHKEAIKQKEYGARPIMRLIQDNIEDSVTELLLNNEYPEKTEFSVHSTDGKINVTTN